MDRAFKDLNLSKAFFDFKENIYEVMENNALKADPASLINQPISLDDTALANFNTALITRGKEAEAIALYGARFKKLPNDFAKGLHKLKKLTIRAPNLTSLPTDFGKDWENIEWLEIKAPLLKELPADMGKGWRRLQMLKLVNTQVKTMPKHLRNVKCQGCPKEDS